MDYEELPVLNEPNGDPGTNPNNLNNLIKYVPTLDDDVKSTLRDLNQPITNYGEGKPERRERLINIILKTPDIRRKFIIDHNIPLDDTELGQEISGYADDDQDDNDDDQDDDDEEFYTPGPEELITIRSEIADFSLLKAKQRVNEQEIFFQSFNEPENLINRRNKINNLKNFQLFISQIVSDRCTSILRFSKNLKNSNLIAAGSWNGQTYIMNQERLNCKYILVDGHEEKIGGVDWNPTESTHIATSGNEGNIAIFDINTPEESQAESDDPIEINPSLILKGHTNRVTRLDHHPCGKYLASASFDTTWRYWDLTKGKELFFQEGHSKEVFTVCHHPDGSLISSGGLDAITRIWDLRIGRSIAVFQDHIKGIYSMDWRSNGYNLITGSGDNSIKIWDLRKSENSICTIGGHKKLVSDIKISKDDKFFISSGYDGLVNIYSCDNWLKLKTFTNNEKQMTCDISLNDDTIISGGWDRSLKLYTIN
ncbi:unnamed protein product [[Candida] boidinii]|uniref:Unnamed protein product n=1 Tax=Candida boidinii TaxID=5477 RepID=A0ACB5TXY6_CANBO|nr:unnamed protein product [[Candida] boidinii]